MIFEFSDYRTYLQAVLEKRKGRNASYSLRAFAQSLGVPVSTLSEALNHRKPLTLEAAKKMAGALKLRSNETRYFVLLAERDIVEKNSPRAESIELDIRSLVSQAGRIKLSGVQTEVLAHNLMLAIIELGGIKGFELTAESAAKALVIPVEQSKEMLSALERQGTLKKQDEAGYVKVGSGVLISSEGINLNLRHFHMDMMDRAKRSLIEQTPQERIVGSETFSFDSNQLAEANEIIEDFFSKMVALANRSTQKDSVYHLGVQMFRMTQAGAVTCKK